MDLTLSETEKLVQEAARDFLGREVTTETVAQVEASGEFPWSLWRGIAGNGWFGAGIPSEQGGGGGSLVDWATLLMELGRVACPGPVVEQLTVAAYLSSLQPSPRLTGVLAGETVVSLAVQDRPGDPLNAPDGSSGAVTLEGSKMLVPYGESAGLLLVSTGEGGDARYFAVEPHEGGVAFERLHSVTRDQQALATFDGARAEALGRQDPNPRKDLIELYRLAKDAYAVGLMDRILDMSVSYAKDRVQFGRPIGSFQAVQYRCVDMAVAYYGSQNLVQQAAWLVGNERPCARELLICHAGVRDAAGETVANGHQLHGAMGFTDAYPLQLFTRRAKVYQHTLGTAAEFREQLAEVERDYVLPEQSEPLWGGFV